MKEVMSRLGHSTTAAAIRYQRAADVRDREVADRLDQAFGTSIPKPHAVFSRYLVACDQDNPDPKTPKPATFGWFQGAPPTGFEPVPPP